MDFRSVYPTPDRWTPLLPLYEGNCEGFSWPALYAIDLCALITVE